MNVTRILGLDPGLRVSGYVLLAGTRVELSGVLPNEDLVDTVIPSLLEPGTLLAIEEMTGQGRLMAGPELKTVRWSGRFEERWIRLGGAVRFVTRSVVKRELLGRMTGTDGAVRSALVELWGGDDAAFGPRGQKKKKGIEPIRGPLYGISSHAWSALAVAVTVRDQIAREALAAATAPACATREEGAATSARGTVPSPPEPLPVEMAGARP